MFETIRPRILAIAVAAPIALLVIFWVPDSLFRLFVGLFVAACLFEWCRLCGRGTAETSFIMVLGVALSVVPPFFPGIFQPTIGWVAGTTCVLWLAGFAIAMSYPRSKRILERVEINLLLGFVFCVGAGCALIALRETPNGPAHVATLLVLVWTIDSAAYLCGQRLGRHRWPFQASPSKTWEGLIGGAAGAIAITAILLYALGRPLTSAVIWTSVLVVFVTATLGDLFESSVKRTADVKDSGVFLPGHGGVLDRLDATLASLPFFYLFVASP